MPNRKSLPISARLEQMSTAVTRWTGSSQAFTLALMTVAAWAAVGRLFDYSDTWQLVINTGTTIVTFLMVFLIQRTQNKDSLAIHLKLNEIVAALEGSSNRLIDIEALGEDELEALRRHFHELAALARKETDITVSHSVEEARQRHSAKLGATRRRGKSGK
jgi:low affinity Fe/Cu permease